jgi:type IV pilus assembly protein PilW
MSQTRPSRAPGSAYYARGLSLVELMVSLVLGLLVTGAALGVFMSNRQTYTATESLGRIQEGARVAFELMARDVREAGANACAKNLPMANVLNNPGSEWWRNWNSGLVGVDGAFAMSEPAGRVAGTDAIEVKSASSGGVTVVKHQSGTSASFQVNSNNHGLNEGDIVMVCDYRQATIMQTTNVNSSNMTVVHNSGTGSPGNCTDRIGVPVPVPCTNSAGIPYVYSPNSVLARLQVSRWYVRINPRNQRSLYRSTLVNTGGVPTVVDNEIIEGVQDMQITYLLPNDTVYRAASAIGTRWDEVLAARIEITLDSEERIGTDGNPIRRQLVHVVTLRNRNA